MKLASWAFSFGRKMLVNPFSFACFVIGRAPVILLTFPVKESSPIIIEFLIFWDEIWLSASRIAVAIARSKCEPCFRSWAGARFMVFLVCGNFAPLFFILVLTLSFDSWTDVSPSPTIENEGRPELISAWTSTVLHSSPAKEHENTFPTIICLVKVADATGLRDQTMTGKH